MKTCTNCGGELPATTASEIRCEYCGIRYTPEELAELAAASGGGGGTASSGGANLQLLAALVVAALVSAGAWIAIQRRNDVAQREPRLAAEEHQQAEIARRQAAQREASTAEAPTARARRAAAKAERREERPLAPEHEDAPSDAPATPRPAATPPGLSLEADSADADRADARGPGGGRLPARTDAAERIRWDSVGGPPQVVTIDGAEHVVGRLRSFGEDELFAAAVAADGAAERWRVGPLTTYSEGYRHTHILPAGAHVVVTLPDPAVAVLALSTGEAQRSLALEKPVQDVWDAGDGAVGLRSVGGEALLLDPAAGSLTPVPREDVPPRARPRQHRRDAPAPTIDGLNVVRTLREGDAGLIVCAGEDPRVDRPRVIGYDPDAEAVRWVWSPEGEVEAGSNEADDLRGGVYATVYQTRDDERWHLVALDVDSGETTWETLLPDIFAVDKADGMVVGKEAIYVHRTSSIDVVRLTDGVYQGAIGTETYED